MDLEYFLVSRTHNLHLMQPKSIWIFHNIQLLSPSRYNLLFTQVLNITVPSNFDLHAGDVIGVDVPKIGCNFEFDDNLSGNYVIKELCHYIDDANSFTSLRLVRDTQGRKTTSA